MAELRPVVEACGGCGAGFTHWLQLPPCGKECPYHRDFRIRETKIAESLRALGAPPKHNKCGRDMSPIDRYTNTGAHLTWECAPCNLMFSVGEI